RALPTPVGDIDSDLWVSRSVDRTRSALVSPSSLMISPAPLPTDRRRWTTGSSPGLTPTPAGLTHARRRVPRSGYSAPHRTACAGSGAAALAVACGAAPWLAGHTRHRSPGL